MMDDSVLCRSFISFFFKFELKLETSSTFEC